MRRARPTAAVVFAALLLCFLCVAVGINAVFVRRSVAELTRLADALPSTPDGTVAGRLEELARAFARRETALSVSVSFPLLDRVKEQITTVRAYAEADSAAEYTAAVALLREALQDMARPEHFSARNV